MAHSLHVFPDSTASAAQNMAFDFLLLQRYKPTDAIRFHHYNWSRASYTFGLSQRYSYVQSEIPSQNVDLCRRPTGGGVVNHLEDWTYSLVIPSSHPMSHGQPIETYRAIHQAIVDAMGQQGVQAELNFTAPEDAAPGVCFSKPELYDIVLKNLPTKISGAAQKRTKAGFLMQGSIWKPMLPDMKWERFYNDFLIELSTLFEAQIEYVNTPSWDPSEEEAVVEQFESENWNERR